MRKILKENITIVLILLAAFLIRIIGTNPGYPPYHPDEPMSYSSAMNMIINGNLDPKRYDYPAGVPLVHMVFYRIFFLPIALFKLFFPHPRVFFTALQIGPRFMDEFKVAIFGRGEYEALFFSRYVTAILGAGIVFLTYLLQPLRLVLSDLQKALVYQSQQDDKEYLILSQIYQFRVVLE